MSNEADSSREFVPPLLSGRYTYLRPVTPRDYHNLRVLELSPEIGVRWRFRGATPTQEQWVQAAGAQFLEFVVVRSADQQPLGVVRLNHENFKDQHAHAMAASFATPHRSPLMVFGIALFIDYVFKCWNFRKLYFELPEYNLPQFASGLGSFLVQEGRLRQHLYYDGRYWDSVTLALYRRTWEERSARVLRITLPTSPPASQAQHPAHHGDFGDSP